MLTGRQLTGLVVRDVVSGKNVGRISDIYVDSVSGQIRGFAVTSNALWARSAFLPASAVESIGLSGVLAEGAALKGAPTKGGAALSWRGSVLRSAAGQELGVVSDLIVDEGRVAALEISGGLWSDVKNRRSLVTWERLRPAKDGFVATAAKGGENYEQ